MYGIETGTPDGDRCRVVGLRAAEVTAFGKPFE